MKKNVLIFIVTLLLSSCSSGDFFNENPVEETKGEPGLFSKDSSKGISISDILSGKDNQAGSINVNAYLWRASLNILSIAPGLTAMLTLEDYVFNVVAATHEDASTGSDKGQATTFTIKATF